ncbi:phosphopyruvate hydratase [Parasedimentitalea psychrophila]|uniref:Enolase n=1 Tax=Parasedimentitalea psychrophila TaxID=2997337 RepID=A0A9Y2KZ93_9RHOB|nr:phosphopyruvate hydratase [Parasedimentitalea psychrophila]WIY24756.1 phosphopyruvate hydratase [Parasedimentitalea psychrophila]
MADTTIASIKARQVWDSRGRPTVEAEVTLASGRSGRSIAPAGASRGKREAIDLRDGGTRLGGLGVNKAIDAVNRLVGPALTGMDAADQRAIDTALIALDGTAQKSTLGGNACVAVSGAVAWAASAELNMPLWQHLQQSFNVSAAGIPAPMIQIFGGGAHAGNRVDVQDFLVICNGATSFAEAAEWTAEIYIAAHAIMKKRGQIAGVCDEGGLWPDFDNNEVALGLTTQAISDAGLRPGTDVSLALDVAASEFWRDGRYHLALENRSLSTGEFIAELERWSNDYPIVSLEDPLGEDDTEGFVAITELLGDRMQIIGDDYLTTSAAQVEKAGHDKACNSVLLKSNQCGTISEVFDASQAARSFGWNTVMSGRSGETEDVTLSHLAVGFGADQIKVGSMTRSERTCKWNEVIRIEERNRSLDYWTFLTP